MTPLNGSTSSRRKQKFGRQRMYTNSAAAENEIPDPGTRRSNPGGTNPDAEDAMDRDKKTRTQSLPTGTFPDDENRGDARRVSETIRDERERLEKE